MPEKWRSPDFETLAGKESELLQIGKIVVPTSKVDNNTSEVTSQDQKEYLSCPNSPGSYTRISLEKGRVRFLDRRNLPCKKWDCPYCGPKKKLQVYARLLEGNIKEHFIVGNGYSSKMVTLTVPGLSYRHSKSIKKAEIDIKSKFNHLMTIVRRRYGIEGISYFWVCEPQTDGYPHLHVAFVGEKVIAKEFYGFVDYVWQNICGMGFTWVSVKASKVKTPLHAINYLTKYMGKGLKPIRKHGRVFSCSRGAMAPVRKTENDILTTKIFIGDNPRLFEQTNILVPLERIDFEIPYEYLEAVKVGAITYGYGYYEQTGKDET